MSWFCPGSNSKLFCDWDEVKFVFGFSFIYLVLTVETCVCVYVIVWFGVCVCVSHMTVPSSSSSKLHLSISVGGVLWWVLPAAPLGDDGWAKVVARGQGVVHLLYTPTLTQRPITDTHTHTERRNRNLKTPCDYCVYNTEKTVMWFWGGLGDDGGVHLKESSTKVVHTRFLMIFGIQLWVQKSIMGERRHHKHDDEFRVPQEIIKMCKYDPRATIWGPLVCINESVCVFCSSICASVFTFKTNWCKWSHRLKKTSENICLSDTLKQHTLPDHFLLVSYQYTKAPEADKPLPFIGNKLLCYSLFGELVFVAVTSALALIADCCKSPDTDLFPTPINHFCISEVIFNKRFSQLPFSLRK